MGRQRGSLDGDARACDHRRTAKIHRAKSEEVLLRCIVIRYSTTAKGAHQ